LNTVLPHGDREVRLTSRALDIHIIKDHLNRTVKGVADDKMAKARRAVGERRWAGVPLSREVARLISPCPGRKSPVGVILHTIMVVLGGIQGSPARSCGTVGCNFRVTNLVKSSCRDVECRKLQTGSKRSLKIMSVIGSSLR